MVMPVDNTVLANVVVRTMQAGDLEFAAQCTASEGWVSEDRPTLEGFFMHDPEACFIAEDHGRLVGMCIATDYGSSGFIGELIVQPEARGRGVGAWLLNHSVQVLFDRGVETIYLDGVVKAVSLYQRHGFRKVCRSWRYSGHLFGRSSSEVKPMDPRYIDQVCAIDRMAFGADRSFFLRRRVELYPELCFVMTDGELPIGYIMGRGAADWVAAGPWVMLEAAQNPLQLLTAFALAAGGRAISLGILETNQAACNLVRSLGFSERPDSPWRMVLGGREDLGASSCCYAVGSAAKG